MTGITSTNVLNNDFSPTSETIIFNNATYLFTIETSNGSNYFFQNSNTTENCIKKRFELDIQVPIAPNPYYISIEIFIGIVAILCNSAIISLYTWDASLRRSTANMYIISLALADFLVGLVGIPTAIATSMGLPTNFHFCLFTTSLLLLICTTSILNLVTVTVDRYLAVVHPLRYQAYINNRKVRIIIACNWIVGSIVGSFPLLGWNMGPPSHKRCFFMEVNDLRYLVFLFCTTIILPSLFMACVYVRIHKEISKQLEKISATPLICSKTNNRKSPLRDGITPTISTINENQYHHNHHHHQKCLGQSKQLNNSTSPLSSFSSSWKWKREVKVVRSLVRIVTAFMLSWAPLYAINTLIFFKPCLQIPGGVIEIFICLSHLNSVWNPLIYAFGTKDFKKSLFKVLEKLK